MNSPQNSCLYEFEGFVLDPIQRVLRTLVDGQMVRLSSRAFDALHLLVSHHGQLIDKDTLIRSLWPKAVVEENSLTQVISALRQSLGEKPGEHRFIFTAPGRGYQFVAAVKEVPRITTPNDPAELTVKAKTRTGSVKSRLLLHWGLVALGSVVIASAWWLVGRTITANTNAGQEAISTATKAMTRSSVAVLPFVNLTGDPSKDYLGDGMAEELINTLARVEGLRVPARTSTFSYKGRNADARKIAKDLSVDTLLEGSVRSAGTTIRITAQLIDAQTDTHLWSETYDRKLTDLFKLQGELATAIVQALQVNLHGALPTSVAQTPPTQDVEAYRLYLQASSLTGSTKEDYRHVTDLASQAVTRDPSFARAYGVLATGHMGLYVRGEPAEHLALAKQFAQQGLKLNQDIPLAQTTLGQVSLFSGDWLEMESHDRAALALASNDAYSLAFRSVHVGAAGKRRAATEVAQRAYALAPANARAVAALARALHAQGLKPEAMKFANLALALGLPKDDTWLVNIYAHAARSSGDYAESAALLISMLSDYDVDGSSRQAVAATVRLVHAALADPKQRAAALTALEHLYAVLQTASANPVARVRQCNLGLKWYVLLNAVDHAVSLAMRCSALGGGAAASAAANDAPVELWGPEMRPFRQNPRFQDYVSRFGDLMAYWEKYGPPDDCDFIDGKLTCH